MRYLSTVLSSICLASIGLGADSIRLIPEPRELKPGDGYLEFKPPIRIDVLSGKPEDRFSADLLVEELKQGRGIAAAVGKRLASIRIRRNTELDWDEGYRLTVDPKKGVDLEARTAQGVFYGVQTLRQLFLGGGADGPPRLPVVTIRDWPVMRHRGLSFDVSRGAVPTEDEIKLLIRTMAEMKLNMLSFYMEHVFPYSHSPGVAPEGAEMPPELLKRVAEYAAKYHVEILPQQQTFAHLHHMLKVERYADMAETTHGMVLAAESERAYRWIDQASKELSDALPGRLLHIGSDETFELGKGRSKEYVAKTGVANVYLDHMLRVAGMLKPLNRRLLFWGDIALNHPEIIPKLPKDFIAATWTYGPADDFTRYVQPFRDAGLDVFVCPGLNNWNRIYPNVSNALKNINNFVRDGKKLGAVGMLNTDWRDDGEALFGMAWYGVVFSAAAAWQQGLVDVDRFDRSFDWAFYRNSRSSAFAKSIRKLDQVHELFQSAGLREAGTELFWADPFSRAGVEQVRKLLPIASQFRVLAEEVWADLDREQGNAKRHQPTIEMLKFAAKRIDYLGMKAQFAKEIADFYREARSQMGDRSLVNRNLHLITSTNGRLQDLRDAINELKASYRERWLSENRPYWLDNVLVNYEYEALHWRQRARQFVEVRQQYAQSQELPDAETLRMVFP